MLGSWAFILLFYFIFLFPTSLHASTLEKYNSILSSGLDTSPDILLLFFYTTTQTSADNILVRTPHHTLFDSYQPALENWLS